MSLAACQHRLSHKDAYGHKKQFNRQEGTGLLSMEKQVKISKTMEKPQEKTEKPQLLPARKYDWYFEPKSFEKSGKLYEILGVKIFQKLLFGLKEIYSLDAAGGILPFEKSTRVLEAIHIVEGSIVAVITAGCIAFKILPASLGISINIIANIYPIMLQRYNRARVYGILEKKQEMQGMGNTESD